jgi:hypothetical protein
MRRVGCPADGWDREPRGKRKMPWGGGRRKPLKTLDPDKGIKGNQSLFLG